MIDPDRTIINQTKIESCIVLNTMWFDGVLMKDSIITNLICFSPIDVSWQADRRA
jgi:hypothetical protein